MPACDSLLCSDTFLIESIILSNPALQPHLHLHSRLSCSLHDPAFLFQLSLRGPAFLFQLSLRGPALLFQIGNVLRMQRGELGGGVAEGGGGSSSLLAGLCATFEQKLGDAEESVQKRIGTSFNVLLANSNCSICSACLSMMLMACASEAAFLSSSALRRAAAASLVSSAIFSFRALSSANFLTPYFKTNMAAWNSWQSLSLLNSTTSLSCLLPLVLPLKTEHKHKAITVAMWKVITLETPVQSMRQQRGLSPCLGSLVGVKVKELRLREPSSSGLLAATGA